jgi:hypothetical protein
MEGVFIPEHEGNRFPFGEEAFPLDIPMVAPKLMDEDPGSEFGFRLQSTLGSSDFSLSYFDGRDRSFTPVGYNELPNLMPSVLYRKTSVLGFDLVSFIGDFTNRFEIGYFSTENDVKSDMKTLNDASYIQFTGQVEYSTENDIMFSLQIIGSEILEINGTITEDEFQPGMGTPFAMFTDLGLSFSASSNYFDDALELMGNTFIDLAAEKTWGKDSQSMLGASAKYSPMDNWKLNMSVSKFMGDEGTQFHEMEDFSHLKVGLEFHF